MKNSWSYYDQPYAAWYGDVQRLPDSPEAFAALGDEIVRVGTELEVYVPREARSYRERWATEQKLDLFPRSEWPSAARLAYYDASGTIVESLERGMGDLVGRLGTAMDGWEDGDAERLRHRQWPALSLSAARVDYTKDGRWSNDSYGAGIGLSLFTDIWFPEVHSTERHELVDNRPLARRHTPRLNEFLRRIAQLVESVGGSWEIDDDVGTRRPWRTRDGISLE